MRLPEIAKQFERVARKAPSRLSEHIIEVRFEPTAKVLDRRGEWAERISEELGLPHWGIVENRVNVFNEKTKESVFVSFRNCGFTYYNAESPSSFVERAAKFLRFLEKQEILPEKLNVHRAGVLSKFLDPYPGTFKELLTRYQERYSGLTQSAQRELGARVVDIGVHLNFADNTGNFNTVCGPMAEKQMKQFIEHQDVYPAVALYYHIDYWTATLGKTSLGNVAQKVKTFADEGWRRYEAVRGLILGG